MTEISSTPSRLPVLDTLRAAIAGWVKAAWRMILLMLLYYGAIIGVVIVLAVALGAVSLVIGGGGANGLSPVHWVIVLGVPLFVAIALRFSIAGYRLADESLEGRRPRLLDLLREPRPSLLAYFGLILLSSLLILLGFGLLVVPGVYLALALSVVLLPMIFENAGILDSMKRSVELTRGNLLRILAVYLLVGLGYLVYVLVLSGLMTATSVEDAITPVMVALMALNAVFTLCFETFSIMLQVVLYRRLRALKEAPAVPADTAPAPEASGAA